MLESYHRLRMKTITVPQVKDGLQLISSPLLEEALDNTVKDFRKRPQHTCQPVMTF